MILASQEPEENHGCQVATAIAPKSGTDAETLDDLDAEVLAALRAAARSRKNNFLRTGSALRLGMRESKLARRIARERGIGWKSRDYFICDLVRESIARLETAGLIQRKPRQTPTGKDILGFVVTMPGAKLTAWDRFFLRSILVAWDADPATSSAGRGGRNAEPRGITVSGSEG